MFFILSLIDEVQLTPFNFVFTNSISPREKYRNKINPKYVLGAKTKKILVSLFFSSSNRLFKVELFF
jgi:hypothetical protein